MKSITVSALGIAFKIWFFAVLFNTVADTLFLSKSYTDFPGIAFLIALFGAMFSAPVFLILWATIYSLLQAGRPAGYIIKCTLLIGIGLAIAAWFVFAGLFNFFDEDILGLSIIAPVSGAIAIRMSYSNIKNACYERDAGKNLIETIGTERTDA